MSTLRATTIALVLCPALLAATVREAPSSLIDTELDRALQDVVAAPDGPPGAIAVVQRGGRLEVFTAGLGDVAQRRRMRPTDHMRVASVAKAFSGAVALSLVDRGLLSLDDTLGELLPGLGNGWESVTLRDLLNHTSGVPSFTSSLEFAERIDAFPRVPVPPRALVEYVADEELEFEPGSRYSYSNTDNILVGLMAEAATGRAYQHLLAARVLSPLGLRQTSLPSGYRMPRPYIHGYDVAPGLPFDVSEILAAGYTWASGGVVSTPLELNRFIRAYAGGKLFGGEARAQQLEFIPGASSEPPGPGRNSAGLGIFRYETDCGTLYGHTGNIFGYTQFAAATLDGRRSVVVSVNEQISPGIRDDVFELLHRAYEVAACAALAD
ncbi:MAG TPA: serine hydrolase domain-containing protein [Candidatus Binatia bacterium]